MYARNHLGDTRLDACLLTKLGNVGTALADDDTSLLGGDESTKLERSVGVDGGTLDVFVASDVVDIGSSSSSGGGSGVSSVSNSLGLVVGNRSGRHFCSRVE